MDAAKKLAIDEAGQAIRDLAANLLRIIAHGGSEPELYRQIGGCAWLIDKCIELGVRPAEISLGLKFDNLSSVRNLSTEDRDRWRNDGTIDQIYALHDIVIGSLRLAASDLALQPTQSTVAEQKIHVAARDLETAKEKYRRTPRPRKL